MDDLTKLKGIGKAGEAALQAAGFSTFAAIAEADEAKRPDGLSASVDWADVIVQAREFSTDTQGQSGTAREAPSTDSWTATQEAAPVVGTQSAAPLHSDDEEIVATHLLVTGPKRGRWRAGRHFTPEPTLIDLDDLDEGEEDAILGDRTLTVQVLSAETLADLQGAEL